VRFELFKDRNFVSGCLFMVLIGLTLFGTMALVTPFLQNVMNYPILSAGMLLASRGIGTLVAMMTVGRLMRIIEARYLVLAGLLITAFTLSEMTGFTDNTSSRTIAIFSVMQGVGLGLVFVPLSTVAFATLPGHLRTDGAAILTLVRNIGSSIGISMVIAELTNTTVKMHAHLTEYVTPFSNPLKMPDVASILNTATDQGRALIDAMITQQAAIIAYGNDFKLLMVLTLIAIPLVFLIRTSKKAGAGDHDAVLD